MKIIKRNGSEAVFDISKIITAITKANNADENTKELTSEQILQIASSVEESCAKMNLMWHCWILTCPMAADWICVKKSGIAVSIPISSLSQPMIRRAICSRDMKSAARIM